MAQTKYGRDKSAPKHAPLDLGYGQCPDIADVYGFIRFGEQVLVCETEPASDGSRRLGFISGPAQKDSSPLTSVARATLEATGLELSTFGTARFVIPHDGASIVGQVVTARASGLKLSRHARDGARFMPLQDVLLRQNDFCTGVLELISRVENMGYGFDKFVQTARRQAGALALASV